MYIKPKILVLEDEPEILYLVEQILQEENYEVLTATDAEKALEMINQNPPTAIISDIVLPGMSGIDFFKHVKNDHPDVPVMFLSGLTDEFDKVLGLELGAEDYITKPFQVREFKARVKVMLRRLQPTPSSKPQSKQLNLTADLTIDTLKRQVFIGQKEVSLTKKEFDILILLSSRPGQVYTREQILDMIWQDDTHISDRTVDVHIGRLRDKINIDQNAPPLVETVRGVGYRYNPNLEVEVISS